MQDARRKHPHATGAFLCVWGSDAEVRIVSPDPDGNAGAGADAWILSPDPDRGADTEAAVWILSPDPDGDAGAGSVVWILSSDPDGDAGAGSSVRILSPDPDGGADAEAAVWILFSCSIFNRNLHHEIGVTLRNNAHISQLSTGKWLEVAKLACRIATLTRKAAGGCENSTQNRNVDLEYGRR